MNLNNYRKIKVKDFTNEYGTYLWARIRSHSNGSLYHLNAITSDCYTFNPEVARHGTTDWEWCGGWDWAQDIIDPLEYLYNFKDKKLYQLK